MSQSKFAIGDDVIVVASTSPARGKVVGTEIGATGNYYSVDIEGRRATYPESQIRSAMFKSDPVNNPAHYGGADNVYEAIKVIEAWGLGFCLGNTVKYISRAGKKGAALEDLKKARWYLDREIQNLEKKP